jgi:hypothetical protein
MNSWHKKKTMMNGHMTEIRISDGSYSENTGQNFITDRLRGRVAHLCYDYSSIA